MNLIKGKMRLFCVSNILVSFVCTNFLSTTYYNTFKEVGQNNQQEISANDEVDPLSQTGEGDDILSMVIEVPDVKEIVDTLNQETKKTTTSNIATKVVAKKEVKATTTYAPAKYNEVTGNAIVEYAKRYLGLRYVSGGFSLSTGTDCSGFTKLIYREFGITISRSAASQASSGTYVRKSDLQKGDLVFYSNGSGRITHVAIYVGNGQVIHESNHRDGVKYSSVNMMQYITARRLINSTANKIAEQKLQENNKNVNTEINTSQENSNDTTQVENVVTTNANTEDINKEGTTTEVIKENSVDTSIKEEEKVETVTNSDSSKNTENVSNSSQENVTNSTPENKTNEQVETEVKNNVIENNMDKEKTTVDTTNVENETQN